MSPSRKMFIFTVYLALLTFHSTAIAQERTGFSTSLYGGAAGVFRQSSEERGTREVSNSQLVTELRARSAFTLLGPITTQTFSLRGEDILDDRGRSLNRVGSLVWTTEINTPRTQSALEVTAVERNFRGAAADLNAESPRPLQNQDFRQQSLGADLRTQFSWNPVNVTGGRLQAQQRFLDSAGTNESFSLFQQRSFSERTTAGIELAADRSASESPVAGDPDVVQVVGQVGIYGQHQMTRPVSLRATLGGGRFFDLTQESSQNFAAWSTEAAWRERLFFHRLTIRQGVSILSVTGQLAQTTELRLQSQWSAGVDHLLRFEGAFRTDSPLFEQDPNSNSQNTRTEVGILHDWALARTWTEPSGNRSPSPISLISGASLTLDRQQDLISSQVLRTGILARF